MGEKWQPIGGMIKYFQGAFRFHCKSNSKNVLRLNPVQIAEWVGQLYEAKLGGPSNSAVTTAAELGISTTRVIQFLNLIRTPGDLRGLLKGMTGLTENKLRPVVQLNPTNQRVAIQRMLGLEVLSRAR